MFSLLPREKQFLCRRELLTTRITAIFLSLMQLRFTQFSSSPEKSKQGVDEIVLKGGENQTVLSILEGRIKTIRVTATVSSWRQSPKRPAPFPSSLSINKHVVSGSVPSLIFCTKIFLYCQQNGPTVQNVDLVSQPESANGDILS